MPFTTLNILSVLQTLIGLILLVSWIKDWTI